MHVTVQFPQIRGDILQFYSKFTKLSNSAMTAAETVMLCLCFLV